MVTSSSYAISPWLTCYQPRPQAQLRLFCFPHGGGGPQIYREWAQALPDNIEVFALSLPGRGSRRHEPAITKMDDLAAAIVTALKNHLDKPIAFFGHSVGALVCFETARHLRTAGLPLPIRLLVSAHKAPHDSLTQETTYTLPDAELLQFIRTLGLVPDDALDNQELVDLILPPIKADFEISETYAYRDESPLPCPIAALGGRKDGVVSDTDLAEWKQYTKADFAVQMYDGDHFYTQSHQDQLLQDIQTHLLADLKDLPLSIVMGKAEPYPEKCLHELFREQAAQHPDEIAIADPHQQLTFRELDECTDLLARYLQHQGTVVDSIVGIYMESSVEYVIAYLSILKAGGGYMTLEIAYPEALLQRALTKATPVFVLTKKAWGDRLPSEWQTPEKMLALDTQWQTKLQRENLPPIDQDRALPTLDSLAYCVMTSGTTGQPKVILAPHRGSVNSYYWRYLYHPYEPGEREACNVFLVWEVIRALLQGHSSYVIPDAVIYDPWKLVEFLETYQITRVLFTPSLLEQVLNTPNLDLETRLHHLKIVWLNGEVVPTELRNRFFQRLPHIKLINDYSISECHDVCTYDLGDLDTTLFPKYTTVGFPMSNVYLYLLDKDLKPVPQGMSAEIYVGGDSLAIGYLNDPEKTAERFVLDPLRNDGSRLFRTGDLGRIAADGTLEIKGRVQFMIKLRGYSIVLSAVETTIIDHPAVNSAVVLTKDNPETQQPEALVAYIVGNGSVADEAIAQELRTYLKDQLPHYAIPSYFIPIQELPLNDVTGKLDRKKLPHPDTVTSRRSTSASPTTATVVTSNRLSTLEEMITDAWEAVLNVRSSDVTDNFFDLGGHSLLAIRMCTALSEKLGVNVSVIDVYEYPTVRMLAQFLQPQVKDTLKADTQGASQNGHQARSTAHQPDSNGATNHAQPRTTATDIAVIGMSCRFPGADNPDIFWQNLANGVCSIRELSEAELEKNGVPSAIFQDENYRRWGAVLDDVDQFDNTFWGLSKKESELMDPQHRIFLECCWQALENAGYAPSEDGDRTGVFGGCYTPTYLLHALQGGGLLNPTDPTEFHLTELGNDKDYLATRVSYLLNLQGPSVTVQTSCSTAAATVATACQSLLSHQCDTAVAGAASLIFPQAGYQYVEGHVNSRDGKVRTFDAQADGTIFGDGAGVVVLKRLEDALEAGDNIIAVIKGFAVNNDGNAKAGYSAPSVQGQKGMIADALKMANVSPTSISYVEAHGTGTLIGDPIEVRALTDVFRQDSTEKGFCALGSVKPNIGHSNIAAGMAGLIKVIQSLHHKQIAPTLNFEQPNPAIRLEDTPFYVNTQLKDWTTAPGQPRRAGLTCLGIGGTNCHLILEEAPQSESVTVSTRDQQDERSHHLLTLSAKSLQSLEQNRQALLAYLRSHPDVNLHDVEYTLQMGRSHHDQRLAIPCTNYTTAVTALEQAGLEQAGLEQADLSTSGISPAKPPSKKTVFLFPGQGSQHPFMGYGLYHTEPTFRAHFDQCCDSLMPMIGVDLRILLYPADQTADNPPKQSPAFEYAYYLQPAIFSLQYALAKTLMEWGIVPDAVAGHSIGEYTAACIAGVLTLEDSLKLIVARGRGIERAPEGAMLSVSVSDAEARTFLEKMPELTLAVLNSPKDMVLSGAVEQIAEAEAQLKRQDIGCRRVHVNRAFHSPMMDAAAEELTAIAHGMTFNPPQIPILSNVTGTWMAESVAPDAQYWGNHMRQSVQFVDNIQTLLQDKPGVILEVGSHKILSKLLGKFTQALPDADRPLVLPCLRHPRDLQTPDIEAFGQAIATFWQAGRTIDWPAFHGQRTRRRIALPTYQFDRQRCWPERIPASTGLVNPMQQVASTGKIADIRDRAYIPSWSRSVVSVDAAVSTRPSCCWLVLMDGMRQEDQPGNPPSLGAQLARSLEQQGDTVVRVFRSLTAKPSNTLGGYTLNPSQPDAYQELLTQLRTRQLYPNRVLDLWNLTGNQETDEPDLSICYYHNLFLAQAIATQPVFDPLDLWIVTDNTVQVSQESVAAVKSTLFGPATVLPQEYPHITCRVLDVQPQTSGDNTRLATQILQECAHSQPDPEPLVALRGHHRWVQRFEPMALLPSAKEPSRLRSGGVYLITGGLGRIAGTLSDHLAQRQAKLVLTSSRSFPSRSQWQALANDGATSDKLRQTLHHLLQLEQAGAEILVMRTNMRNLAEVKRLLQATVDCFGRIDGIFHAAGVANLQPLPQMTYEISEQEFAPKLYGLVNLERAIAHTAQQTGHKPEFVCLFSSLASILGGLSMTAYTAANRVMDTFVQQSSQPDTQQNGIDWLCVNWDDWEFDYTKEQTGSYEHTTAQFAMSPAEGIETLERLVSHPALTQILIATRPLPPRIEQWLQQKTYEVASPPAPDTNALAQNSLDKNSLEPHLSNVADPAVVAQAHPITPSPNNTLSTVSTTLSTTLEQQVLDIFCDVLSAPTMAAADNFFDVGGDSLLAAQLLLKLRRTLTEHTKDLSLDDLFKHPSARELTTRLVS